MRASKLLDPHGPEPDDSRSFQSASFVGAIVLFTIVATAIYSGRFWSASGIDVPLIGSGGQSTRRLTLSTATPVVASTGDARASKALNAPVMLPEQVPTVAPSAVQTTAPNPAIVSMATTGQVVAPPGNVPAPTTSSATTSARSVPTATAVAPERPITIEPLGPVVSTAGSIPAIVQPGAAPAADARAAAPPAADAIAAGTRLKVTNTDGDGVFIRRTPRLNDKMMPWPDNTIVEFQGEQTEAEGLSWTRVKDPRGNIGWIPSRYLIR